MTDSKPDFSQTAKSWDTYWQGTRDGGAYTSGGISHPLVSTFWDKYLYSLQKHHSFPRIIDIASGSGAVIERVQSFFDGELPDVTCLDVSPAAVNNIQERFPGVQGIVADARDIPLESARFDVVTSQFGVEYAGIDAIKEASRMVAPGGQIALMLHHRSGVIYTECAISLDAIRRVQAAKFVPYAIAMFEAGFRAVRGADRADYEAAGKLLAPAISAVEVIMEEYGEHVAGDTIARLYDDVGRIHSEIQHFEPAEVLGWLERMQGELDAFAERMASMNECALDDEAFDSVTDMLEQNNFTLDQVAALTTAVDDPPLAWVLVATRA